MTAAHSIFPPSSAERWVECPGSIPLEMMFPELADPADSDEGTAAHWLAAEWLLQRSPNATLSPNGTIITDEMRDGAQLWVETVMAHRVPPYVERRVAIPSIHPECFGTPDAYTWDSVKRVLRVFDYKFGHLRVEAFQNWQLICYAEGVLDTLGLLPVERDAVWIEFVVVQPRNYQRPGPVRTWSCKAVDLRPFLNRLRFAAETAFSDVAEIKTGPHCLFCRGRHSCPASNNAALAALEYTGRVRTAELAPAAIGLELRTLYRAQEAIKARLTGLEELATARLKEGAVVPGWTLKATYGRAKWTAPAAEVVAFGELMGLDLKKPLECITPNQAESQAKKQGIDSTVIQAYTETPNTGVTLAPESDLLITTAQAFGEKP